MLAHERKPGRLVLNEGTHQTTKCEQDERWKEFNRVCNDLPADENATVGPEKSTNPVAMKVERMMQAHKEL